MATTKVPFNFFFTVRWIVGMASLLLLSPMTVSPTMAATSDKSFLMVGNSFTNEHQLQEMIKAMLEEDIMFGHSVYAMRFRRPASRFAEDVKDPALQSTIAERSWTDVVLQEQSQIPAFWGTRFQADFDLSVEATKKMNGWIAAAGSETILMLTWGRRTADWAWYPSMFPDFMTMQTRVTKGYETLQNETSTDARPVRIAPAGLAFERIYRSLPGNASADGTDFSRLYEVDGTHPSMEGSYLVACVVYATMTGHDPRHLSNGPPEVPQARQQALREVAFQTVQQYNQQNIWNRKFWERHPPDGQKKQPDDSPSPNDVVPHPSPSNGGKEPSKPYVPQEDDDVQNAAPSSSWRSFWLIVALVGAGVLYVRLRRKGSALPRNPQAAYADIAALNTDDFELVDVPSGESKPYRRGM